MNYEEVKIIAKKKYEEALKEIEFSKEIGDKVLLSLPDGWDCKIDHIVFGLEITKGWNNRNSTDAGEFKLVCKLVESATGEKFKREARANYNQNSLYFLKAEKYIRNENDICIGVSIILYYPENMPDCKIEWKRRWTKEAVISDECLGINQGKA